MSAEPEVMETPEGGDRPVAAYVWLLALAGLASPVPTAMVVAWWLKMVDVPVARVGATLSIGGQVDHPIGLLWTAAPAVLIGGAAILATKASVAKSLKGLTFLAVNCWLVDLLVVGMAVQLPPTMDGVEGFGQPLPNPMLQTLGFAQPVLMLFVIASALWYFRRRVVPEDVRHNVGHAQERLEALGSGGSDG